MTIYTLFWFHWFISTGAIFIFWYTGRRQDELIGIIGLHLAEHSCQCGRGPACVPAAGEWGGWRHTRIPGESCHPLHEQIEDIR